MIFVCFESQGREDARLKSEVTAMALEITWRQTWSPSDR